MIIKNSRRRYFTRADGTEEFVGRIVRYTNNNEEKEILIKAKDLAEDITHTELEEYLEGLEVE